MKKIIIPTLKPQKLPSVMAVLKNHEVQNKLLFVILSQTFIDFFLKKRRVRENLELKAIFFFLFKTRLFTTV